MTLAPAAEAAKRLNALRAGTSMKDWLPFEHCYLPLLSHPDREPAFSSR